MTDTLLLQCDRCGSTRFEIPEHPVSDDVVTCTACGTSKPYEELETGAIAKRRLKGATARQLAAETPGRVDPLGPRVLLNDRV